MGLLVMGVPDAAPCSAARPTGNTNIAPQSNLCDLLMIRIAPSLRRRPVIEPVTKGSHGLVVIQVAATLSCKCTFNKQPRAKVRVEHEVDKIGTIGLCQGRSIGIPPALQIKTEAISEIPSEGDGPISS